MDRYEIRIVKAGRLPFINEISQVSDYAAIRRACRLAKDGDTVEVWRGLECVYATKQLAPQVCSRHHG
jgi:hypothetical protein